MKAILVYVLAAFLPVACFAFSSISPAVTRCDAISALRLQNNNNNNDMPSTHLSDRRSAISIFTMLPLSILVSSVKSLPANAGKGKVVVFGGSGWVGAHVCSNLNKQGYDAVSISRSTDDVQIARTKSILGSPLSGVQYLNLDAATASSDDLSAAMKDSLAVISCVGIAPGSRDVKEGNSIPNSNIAKAAKSAGVPKVVYIGVATSLSGGPAKFLLGDYFKGKADAESRFVKEFGKDKSLIIKPAIVEGGTPGEIRPPGPPGVKAVDVEALAKVVVSGAVGDLTGVIDGNDDITSMAL